eukprot:TRINITY_DN9193_c0_g1_i2.p2 TRINITY_DN9193_c0_g1~~TRINITY_DN9193_c0_g1_i2.p2  ORF type:complete len:167 (+),score=71.28 TRINITY_DN9193_c0_g1_i2:99-599(+)
MPMYAKAALLLLASGATAWSAEDAAALNGVSEEALMASIEAEDCFGPAETCGSETSSAVYLLRKNVKGRKSSSLKTDESEQAAAEVQKTAAEKTVAETADSDSEAKSVDLKTAEAKTAEAATAGEATTAINKAELESIMAESDAAPNLLQTQAEVHQHLQEKKLDL